MCVCVDEGIIVIFLSCDWLAWLLLCRISSFPPVNTPDVQQLHSSHIMNMNHLFFSSFVPLSSGIYRSHFFFSPSCRKKQKQWALYSMVRENGLFRRLLLPLSLDFVKGYSERRSIAVGEVWVAEGSLALLLNTPAYWQSRTFSADFKVYPWSWQISL